MTKPKTTRPAPTPAPREPVRPGRETLRKDTIVQHQSPSEATPPPPPAPAEKPPKK